MNLKKCEQMMSYEGFSKMCSAVEPMIAEVSESLKKYGVTDFFTLTVRADGYISLDTDGWYLTKMPGEKFGEIENRKVATAEFLEIGG